jgi:putative transposase
VLRREGHVLNRKKVQRLWREEGLRVPPRRRKRQRLGDSTLPAGPVRAARPAQVWALDYQFDVTATGRVIKICMSSTSTPASIDADATVACLDKIVGVRGQHPEFIRCDNGPELTANALRDWCRFGGCGTSYIEPGSRSENPWVESYGSRMPDKLLAIEQFDTLLEAQVLVADWRTEYNTYRPHSALGMLTPTEYAHQWRRTNLPQPT